MQTQDIAGSVMAQDKILPPEPQYMNWRFVGDDKMPCLPDGKIVNAHDPENWTNYETAAANNLGVAFVLTTDDPYFFLDIDKCRNGDGSWTPEAAAIFQSFTGALGEISTSGTGLHVLGKCRPELLQDRKHKWDGYLEFYTEGRFIAFGNTGWEPVCGVHDPERDWTDHLLQIVPYREPLGELTVGVDPEYTGPTDDDELIRKMLAASGGVGQAFGGKATVKQLWNADAVLCQIYPDHKGDPNDFDHSSADMALMAHLAFWTGRDQPRMDRLFRQSALYRDKYEKRDDYRTRTIREAARMTTRVYSRKPSTNVATLEPPAAGGMPVPGVTMPEPPNMDGRSLILNNRDMPIWCMENAALIMQIRPEWGDVWAFNEFTMQIILTAPIPGVVEPNFQPREITDNDITASIMWFNRNGFPDATKTVTYDAILYVSHQNTISPVKHYLHDLQWDGVNRISTWLMVYCGAADTPFVREAGKRWLISAVARALRPGCKADCALILEGTQGIGKSTALRTLAGDDWFSDSMGDMHSKDASMSLRGRWIVELPELSAMRRSDVDAVKAYMSRQEERYRPPYARSEVFELRRCVFGGTTNRSDYIVDDTGARRFWPVLTGAIDIPALAADRDQIWAEAVACYQAGQDWWLPRELDAVAAEEAAKRSEDDPWTADVLKIADGFGEVTTRQILEAMQFSKSDMAKGDSMRVAGILNRNGWKRDGKMRQGIYRGLARYVRN